MQGRPQNRLETFTGRLGTRDMCPCAKCPCVYEGLIAGPSVAGTLHPQGHYFL